MKPNLKKNYSKNQLIQYLNKAVNEIQHLNQLITYLKSELKKYELLQNSLTNIVENKKNT